MIHGRQKITLKTGWIESGHKLIWLDSKLSTLGKGQLFFFYSWVKNSSVKLVFFYGFKSRVEINFHSSKILFYYLYTFFWFDYLWHNTITNELKFQIQGNKCNYNWIFWTQNLDNTKYPNTSTLSCELSHNMSSAHRKHQLTFFLRTNKHFFFS